MLLKYVMWKHLGDFEKTHEISKLLNDYLKLIKKNKENLENFIQKYEKIIIDLEKAYIEVRYFPSKFFKEQVEGMICFIKDLN